MSMASLSGFLIIIRSMELPEYRTVYADLTEKFGQGAWITLSQLAEYDGCDKRTARKRYHIPRSEHGINKSLLARRICEKAR